MHTRLPRLARSLTAALVAAATTAGGLLVVAGESSAAPTPEMSLTFTGDPGDYISGGTTRSYTSSNSSISARSDGNRLHMHVESSSGTPTWWDVDLAVPADPAIAPSLRAGTYTDAARYGFQGIRQPGMDIGGSGRGCNEITGSFVIEKAVFGTHNYIEQLDATFEQHCEGGAPALRGRLHVVNPPQPAPSPPTNPYPAATMAFTFDKGGYFSYSSAEEDVIGLTGTSAGVRATVSGRNGDNWTLDLAPPTGRPLAVGAYTGVARAAFRGALQPGLDLSGNGQGCNTITGRFDIQDIAYDAAGGVQRLRATFEQHCEGGLAATWGKLDYRASADTTPTPTPAPTPAPTTAPTTPPAPAPTPGTTTSTTLWVSGTTAAAGAPVFMQATVGPQSTAGAVQFMDGTTPIGAPVRLWFGMALSITAKLAPGPHTLTARFTPDKATYRPSVSPAVTVTVTSARR